MSTPVLNFRNTLRAGALALAVFVATTAFAAGQPKIRFQIASQDLQAALNQFALQSKKDLLFSPDITASKRSKPLNGEYAPEEALQVLLAGTGLVYRAADERTILVEVAPSAAQEGKNVPSSTQIRVRAPADGMRLAQTEQTASPVRAEQRQAEESDEDSKGIPEMLVKGNRSLNTDIERTEDAPQPYVIFSKEEIQRSQALHLGDFLKNRLPMNTETAGATTGLNTTVTGNSGTFSTINLRGLGSNQTLILIDGRRLPARAVSGTVNQPDINGIPLSAIERIEVLPSTAGGIYGGSATGGVINVVMRRDYQGVEGRVTYANTFDTDAANKRLELNGGLALENGRTRIMAAATYLESNALLVGDRDFTARGYELQRSRNRASIEGMSTPPLGATANIINTIVTNGMRQPLRLDPEYGGTVLSSPITHLPVGYAGPVASGVAGLIANAGSYNTDLSNDLSGRRRGLIGTPETTSVSLNVRREFTSWLDAFIDAASMANQGRSQVTGITTSVTLRADAPNNPFRDPIAVRFPEPNFVFDQVNKSTVDRATGGLIARLPHRWTGEIDYGWSRSKYEARNMSPLDSVGSCVLARGVGAGVDPDGAGPLLPCAVGDTRPALNILQDANVVPIDFTPYLLPLPTSIIPTATVLKDVTARFSGPVFSLPAGAVNLSMLAERRKETLEDVVYKSVPASRVETYTWLPERSQEVDSMYIEARVPLISSKNALPLLHELELQLSGRRDQYTTNQQREASSFSVSSFDGPFPPVTYATNEVESTDYTIGLRYSPIDDLALRASYGTGFLPPTVSQIVSSSIPNVTFDLGNDPLRGNTPMSVPGVPWTYVYGGNGRLGPEESESWSVGFIFTPHLLEGLRLSVDYTRIDKVNEIQIPDWQFLLDNQDLYPERFQRGPTRDIDPPEWAGPITYFDTSQINIANTQVESYDIQADYSWNTDRLGAFRAYAVATWQPHYLNQAIPTSPVNDRVGFAGGTLEWRGNIGFTWDQGPVEVSWNSQYFDSYFIYSSDASQASIDAAELNQGSNRVPYQLYHDVLASYRFDGNSAWAGGLLANSEISVGIQNLFDKSPPILAIANTTMPGFSTYGDPRMRRYSISIRKSFN